MRKIIAIFILISNLLYCQDYAVDFDMSKFIESGGISKEVYRKKNGKLELSEKIEYNKDSALVKLAINKELPGGLALKGINYFLDFKNRIAKAEIKISDVYSNLSWRKRHACAMMAIIKPLQMWWFSPCSPKFQTSE